MTSRLGKGKQRNLFLRRVTVTISVKIRLYSSRFLLSRHLIPTREHNLHNQPLIFYPQFLPLHRKKKVRAFPVPSRDVTTKLSLGGNNDDITELFLPRGSLVSDNPAGDGKLVNYFLRCTIKIYGLFLLPTLTFSH